MDELTRAVILVGFIVGFSALFLVLYGLAWLAARVPAVREYLDRVWPERWPE